MEQEPGPMDIGPNTTKQDFDDYARTLPGDQKGIAVSCESGDCVQRGWIINGCYWCGADCCVNPGWLTAQCWHCHNWFAVSR